MTTAREDDDAEPTVLVDGPVASGDSGVRAAVRASGSITWQAPSKAAPTARSVRIGLPDPKSCVVTGAHHYMFPPFLGGWQPKFIEGVCKYCGLVQRSPGWARRKRSAQEQRAAQVVMVNALPPVEQSPRLWDAALDALMHLGGGSASALAAVAAQIDGSALFGATFPTRLESLAHIAVERRSDGTPVRWEVSPSCLVVRDEGLEFTGFWDSATTVELAAAMGGECVSTVRQGGPSRRFVRIKGQYDHGVIPDHVSVVSNPTADMLSALPPLSSVQEALPREPVPGFTGAERFDVASASWVQTNDLAHVAAFRLVRGFERLHVFRTEVDVAQGTAIRGSVYLVKHMAANAEGRSLAVYVQAQSAVVVPRGCDLPGLYGRAAVLASGDLPQETSLVQGGDRRACLVYRGFARPQADLLVTLLSR